MPSLSLEEFIAGTDDVRVADTIADPLGRDPLDEIDHGELRRVLGAFTEELPAREREIIRRRFGLVGDDCETLEQVGTRLQLSRERVRQLEREALHQLRARLDEVGSFEASIDPLPSLELRI